MEIVALAILIGAIQSLFIAALTYLAPAENRRSHWCLASLLIAWAYTMLIVGWWTMPQWQSAFLKYPHLAGTVAPIPFLFGPLHYGYVYFLIRDRNWRFSDLWHLAPFALCTVWLLPFYLQGAEYKRQMLMD